MNRNIIKCERNSLTTRNLSNIIVAMSLKIIILPYYNFRIRRRCPR